MNKKTADFNWPTVIFLLIIAGIPALTGLYILISIFLGSDASYQVPAMVNPLYLDKPWAILIHAGTGFLFFLSMPFQFSGALRLKYPSLHKNSGYIVLVSGCVMGISGIWMHYFLNGGVIDVRYYSLSGQGIALCAAFALAVKHILKHHIKNHRKWMSRAIAIALSLVTLAFIEIVFIIFLGEQAQNSETLIQILHDYGNLIGMVINLLVVEYFLNMNFNNH